MATLYVVPYDLRQRPFIALIVSLCCAAIGVGALAAVLRAPDMPQPSVSAIPPDPTVAIVETPFTRMADPTPQALGRIHSLPVRNHGARPEGVRPYAIVVHATGSGQPGSSLDNLRRLGKVFDDPARQVSAHYGVDRAGTIVRYVNEDRRAWHVAAPGWNDISIGIEMINDNSGADPFPRVQVEATRQLVLDIGARHGIPVEYVQRHRDVQWWDRSDPASNFAWGQFLQSIAHPEGRTWTLHATPDGLVADE